MNEIEKLLINAIQEELESIYHMNAEADKYKQKYGLVFTHQEEEK